MTQRMRADLGWFEAGALHSPPDYLLQTLLTVQFGPPVGLGRINCLEQCRILIGLSRRGKQSQRVDMPLESVASHCIGQVGNLMARHSTLTYKQLQFESQIMSAAVGICLRKPTHQRQGTTSDYERAYRSGAQSRLYRFTADLLRQSNQHSAFRYCSNRRLFINAHDKVSGISREINFSPPLHQRSDGR